MVVAILVYSVVPRPNLVFVIGSRLVLVPVIAGLSYEVIRLAARNIRRRWVRVLMRPGLALQRMTTREPDLAQLEVLARGMASTAYGQNQLRTLDLGR